MVSKEPAGPAAGEHFILVPDLESNRPFRGAIFDNIQALLTPPRLILRPDGGGFPSLHERPRIIFDTSNGPTPRDLEGGFAGYWLVSQRLRQVMEAVDPGAFEFAECDILLADGSPGPKHSLCDVVRELDALDEARSRHDIEVDDDFANGKFYSIGGGASLTFRREVLMDAHVLLTPFSTFVVADRSFVDALRAAGISGEARRSGISTIDAASI
ncbi:TPA: DUF1629 domain-containing protein [Stenotrophomonas maltophilia]|nr:DUF1629 domain-containing protein [Stenotrophomonas maltophilia]HDS1025268.1 DUF1629 domain-containing protein [Stenotrophomonas maltophilia]HDS1029521.1 DUF1629 domain-containing protein [Stenotrophomonas maltophilia]HDS1034139.1 DUF1629 domain-containing protein [Stenotrophomonas maltophilia]